MYHCPAPRIQRQIVAGVLLAQPLASPLASSCSSAYSRIVSSIMKRGSPPAFDLSQQALVHQRGQPIENGEWRIGDTGSGVARLSAPFLCPLFPVPHTASAASSVQPPTNTPSRRNSVCSASVSRS